MSVALLLIKLKCHILHMRLEFITLVKYKLSSLINHFIDTTRTVLIQRVTFTYDRGRRQPCVVGQSRSASPPSSSYHAGEFPTTQHSNRVLTHLLAVTIELLQKNTYKSSYISCHKKFIMPKAYPLLAEFESALITGDPQQLHDALLIRSITNDFTGHVANKLGTLRQLLLRK